MRILARVRTLLAVSALFIFCLSFPFQSMAETVTYPVPDGVLQNVGTYTNSVAPSGSASDKSNSISGNTVIVNGGSADYAFGAVNGLDAAAVTGNQVIVNGTVTDLVAGAAAVAQNRDSAPVTGNSVTVNNGTMRNVYGGSGIVSIGTGSATVNNNSVVINGGTVDYIEGGYASSRYNSATANGNTVTINGGTVGLVYGGGYAVVSFGSAAASAAATGNRVNISGGSISSRIYGGQAIITDGGVGTAAATHNIVTISGHPVFGANSDFYGGLVADSSHNPISGDAFTGNALNVWNYRGNAVRSLQNFQFHNFALPAGFRTGDTALTVTNGVNFQNGSNVDASSIEAVNFMGGGRVQQSGETFTLIDAGGGFTGTIINDGQTLTGKKGVALLYDIQINQVGANVTATVLGNPRLNQQTKALSEGYLGGLSLVTQGADLIAGQGMSEAVSAARAGAAKGAGFGSFGALSGGKSRYNTGSHVDMSSLSLLAGLSRGVDLTPGHLTLGAFVEYGNGSYDTYNSFSNAASVHGDGDIYHIGGGILGRMDFINSGLGHFYAEASGRAGGVHNEYSGSDLRDSLGRKADYDSSSAYYGLHLGVGYVWNINEKASLDLYGKYFWTHQGGDSVRLSTGDPVKFDAVDSNRLRGGARFSYTVNEYISPYIGAAYEYEFNGDAKATTHGYSIKAPNLTGSTGIGELGLSFKPSETIPLSFDLGVQGYVGKREGVTGSLQAKWEF